MNIIETNHLSRYYQSGTIKALDGLTLNVKQGCIFGLLGPNGAGKTTLIKLLLGIVFPTGGSATILQKPIRNVRAHDQIGYLAEHHTFPNFLTPRKILNLYGEMSRVDEITLKKRIPELLKLVHLEKWENVKIKKFSKGMLQRLGIAQALINNPGLLFLDEPTDGIDPVGRREIRDLLVQLRQQGKTIFLNSHLLSEVERISDEIAILKSGKLLRQGPVSQFITRENQYQISCSADAARFENICRRLNISCTPQNGHFNISVPDTVELNRIIDTSRSEQIEIHAIIPQKISLEDFFIDVVEEGK